jgi:hypothetical protein
MTRSGTNPTSNVLTCPQPSTVSWSRSTTEERVIGRFQEAGRGEGRDETQQILQSTGDSHGKLVAAQSHSDLGVLGGMFKVIHGKLVALASPHDLGVTDGMREVIHGRLVAAPTVSWSRPRRKTAGHATVSWSHKPIYNTYIFLTCS